MVSLAAGSSAAEAGYGFDVDDGGVEFCQLAYRCGTQIGWLTQGLKR
jgi:hypothetical protein